LLTVPWECKQNILGQNFVTFDQKLKYDCRFRWVSLQLTTIKNCKRPVDVRPVLKLLPKTVDETYENILLEVEEPHREYITRALQWLTFAGRTLRLEELFEAVVMKPGVAQFRRLGKTDLLVRSLSSLVSVVNRKI
jgi:ankyrin repeat domain-containing protein 50